MNTKLLDPESLDTKYVKKYKFTPNVALCMWLFVCFYTVAVIYGAYFVYTAGYYCNLHFAQFMNVDQDIPENRHSSAIFLTVVWILVYVVICAFALLYFLHGKIDFIQPH